MIASGAIVLILSHGGIHASASSLMSDGVFTGLVLGGLGLQFRSVRRDENVSLAGATVCFALATGTRSAGAAFLLIPILTTCLDHRRSLAAAAIRTGQVAMVAGLVLSVIMAGNWAKNGRFEIGSWTGISLLGKGLLLIEPADLRIYHYPRQPSRRLPKICAT